MLRLLMLWWAPNLFLLLLSGFELIRMEVRLSSGYDQILKMALPISLALLVPQINFITNNIFLGFLGERELACAGITGVYYLTFAVIGSGLNNGLQALIARRAGQNLPKEIGRLFYHGVWVALLTAALGIITTYAVAPFLFRAVIHDQQIATQVIHFLLIRIWGLPLLYLYVMRNALLVGTNQTRFLVWGTLVEAIINILLDYLLIFGHWGFPALGFNGAAYASILAEAGGLLVIYLIIHQKGMHRTFALFEEFKLDKGVLMLILSISTPLVLQYAISIATWEYFYILVEHYGPRALAISNTMRNIFGLFGVFCWSFAATSNTMVSNMIGQGKSDEVLPLVRKIASLSFMIALVIFLLLNVAPQLFLAIYGQGDAFVQEAIPIVRIVSVALLIMSFGTVWLNSVTGTGNSRVNLIIELVTIVLYLVYVYFTLEHFHLPLTWGWASEWVYWLSMFTMSYFYMQSGRWRNKII